MNVLSKLIRVPADVLKAYVCSALVLSIVAAAELTASNIYQSQGSGRSTNVMYAKSRFHQKLVKRFS